MLPKDVLSSLLETAGANETLNNKQLINQCFGFVILDILNN